MKRHGWKVCSATRIAMIFAIATCMFAAGCRRASQSDEQKIQGTWAIVKFEAKGQEMPADQSDKNRLHWFISENKIRFKIAEVDREMTFQLHPKLSPKQIDSSQDADNRYLGIYELDGDDLKVCQVHVEVGRERPTDFSTKDRGVLMVFRRVKP